MNPQLFRASLITAAIAAALSASANGQDVRQNQPSTPAPTGAKPNILFILADDHAWQAVSAYGESRHLIQTPNIDRLAREGMLFDHCLVPNSLCGPARAAIITGTYSHINGFYNNSNSRFDGSQITF